MRDYHSIRMQSQRGIALIAVLWIVAALSIVVTSIAVSVRHEVRSVSTSRETLAGEAIGQAAILLVLQDLAVRPSRTPALSYVDTAFRGMAIRVRVLPLTGLVDVNNASPALLTALLSVAGQLDPAKAAAVAAAAVQTRSAKDSRGRPIGFEAREDLLRVPGIDYSLYAKISALVTADLQGSGRINPLAATDDILLVLASGNAARAGAISAQRESGQAGIDTSSLNSEFIEANASTQRFNLQARVPLSSGSWLLVSRTVDFAGGTNGLQWRTIDSDSRFEPVAGGRS